MNYSRKDTGTTVGFVILVVLCIVITIGIIKPSGILAYTLSLAAGIVIGIILWFVGSIIFTDKKNGKEKQIQEIAVANEYQNYVTKIESEAKTYEELGQMFENQQIELTMQMMNPHACCIPQYYWENGIEILFYIKNGRARDITGAINVLEQEKHNAIVDGYLLETLAQTREASRMAQQAEIYAREARNSASNAQLFAALSYSCFNVAIVGRNILIKGLDFLIVLIWAVCSYND